MEAPSNLPSLEHRIREGLSRVGTAMRSEGWQHAQAMGLNPTQFAILERLSGRNDGLSVKQIASEIGVTQPTATDSVMALEAKGYVTKLVDPNDGRAWRVVLTNAGAAALSRPGSFSGVEAIVATLPASAQEQLLLSLIDIIRGLQDTNRIPVQRMCLSCRHFRPFAHQSGPAPHHCNFVDAAFGQTELRIECHEHEAADPSTQAATWEDFKGHPTIQAR